MDVFSRMVVGFYVSFDPPGAMAVGLCLAHAILPKERWLAKYEVATVAGVGRDGRGACG